MCNEQRRLRAGKPLVLIAVGMLVVLVGCSNSDSRPRDTSKPTTPAPPLNVVPQPGKVEPKVPDALVNTAKAEAEAFLKALQTDPAAASARVAVSFKKQVTGSLIYEDERKQGYSESDTQKYLKEIASGVTGWAFQTSAAAPDGNEFSFRGEWKAANPGRFAVRIAKTGDAWLVTRFAVARLQVSGSPSAADSPEKAWVREAALDFVESLVGGGDDHTLTMAMMTDAFKKDRVPAPSVADPGLPYAKKDVRKWLNENRKDMTAYTLTGPDAKQSFAGQLSAGGKTAAFTLVAVKDSDGNWKVNEFAVK